MKDKTFLGNIATCKNMLRKTYLMACAEMLLNSKDCFY